VADGDAFIRSNRSLAKAWNIYAKYLKHVQEHVSDHFYITISTELFHFPNLEEKPSQQKKYSKNQRKSCKQQLQCYNDEHWDRTHRIEGKQMYRRQWRSRAKTTGRTSTVASTQNVRSTKLKSAS
jgi:hypothetical protein